MPGIARPGRPPPKPTAGVRLRFLGAASWSSGDARAVPLERRDAAVLAYLALEGQTPRATLLDLLWPDADREVARNHFRQRLYRLKRATGAALIEGTEMLSLAASLVVDARDADPTLAGELLPGLDYSDCPRFDAWLAQQRARRRRMHADALIARACELEREGSLDAAIAIAEELVELVPLEEHAHRRLMHLHYLRGDRAAAIAAFERCETLIRNEFGTRPGAETLALLATIESAAGAASPTATRAIPSSILRPPRMIGRARDVETAHGAWDAGRVVLVLGASGLGKSRLLAELTERIDGRVVVRARSGDATVPYALLARWLRAVDGRHAEALHAARPEVLAALLSERATGADRTQVTTAAIGSSAERVLAAAVDSGLCACVVDDLHFADAASLELFGPLMLSDAAERCRWVLARRPDEGDEAADALAGRLADVHRLVVVRLAALDERDIGELVDSLALPAVDGTRLAAPLARHTGGNPLFVLETLREAVVAGGFDGRRLPRPLGVIESIERRVAALSPPAQALVQLAAAAGADFSVRLAEAVLGTHALALADAWREIESAQLIDGEAFVHDLVHEAVLHRVPPPIRRHMHAAVASFLACTNGDRARIADLWLAAGDDREAASALVAAADAARRAGRFVEAGQRSEQAARAFDRLGQAAQAFAQLYRAFDDFTSTASREVQQRLEAELVPRAHGDTQRAMAAIASAQVANVRGDWLAMEAALHEAVAAARRSGERALEAEAQFGLGVLAHSRGEFAESIEQIAAATRMLDALDASMRQAEMRGSLARVSYVVGRVADARAELDRAIPVLRAANARCELAADIGFQALLALEVGDVDEALESSHESYALLADAEAGPHDWLTALGDRLRVLATASRYGEALTLIEGARADQRFEPVPSQARLVESEAGLLFELGRGWQAERLLAPLAAVDGGVAGYRGSRAVLALQGASMQARPVAAARLEQARELVSGVPQRCRYAAIAAPHLPPDAALQLTGSALDLAESLGLKAHLPGLLAGKANALQRASRPDEARHCAQRAVRLLESITPMTYRGAIWLALHDVLTAVGDATTARDLLLQASEWLHRTARQDVPAPFRDSFLGRNAVNRELLLRAMRGSIAPSR
jgi:DNA-binding SARP family transcriptional activator